jgi:ADP-ribosylglycohydrolase
LIRWPTPDTPRERAALYCALTAEDFEDGVLLAVNHAGNSDSIGRSPATSSARSLGIESIPERWLVRLELRETTVEVAHDLARHGEESSYKVSAEEWERYPGW